MKELIGGYILIFGCFGFGKFVFVVFLMIMVCWVGVWFFIFDYCVGMEMVVCVFGGSYVIVCVGKFIGLNLF